MKAINRGQQIMLFPHLHLYPLSPSSMASAGLEKQLDHLIKSMYEEGLLDVQFQRLQMLQNEENPNFVAEVITTFFANTEKVFKELQKSMKETEVNYRKINCYIHQLKGSSASVGAHGVEKACINMRDFCDLNDLGGCTNAFHLLKQEYFHVQAKFEEVLKVEQQIKLAKGNLKQ